MSEPKPFSFFHRLAIMLPVALVFLGLDQWSKAWATVAVQGHPPRTYAGIFTLVYAENLGAWGSMGAGWGPSTRWFVLGVFPALVLAGLAFYALTEKTVSKAEVLACGLVVAGGAGNLIDRFFRSPGPMRGAVVDFVSVGWWPTFNVADSSIVCGAILLVGLTLFGFEPDGTRAKGKRG